MKPSTSPSWIPRWTWSLATTAVFILQISQPKKIKKPSIMINIIIINPGKVVIKTKIILIKSCKKINSSIMGELASCKPN